jgi:hypothetical protein
MTDTEINVAIEAIMDRAWAKRRIQWDYATQKTTSEDVDINEKGIDVYWFFEGKRTLGKPVDYCGSLDAMYKAEAVIINLSDPSSNLWAEYCDTLISILFPESDTNKAELSDLGYALLAIHSSAHKRAEAFLRVHGKWID